ncbi:hypothetical protein [Desulfobacula phenolica]|uniref:Uncharacterized protein n=1 Tax=Desulfobacula phenolica TaxID=90732 RepID=A0A1H2I3W9_9BACT|nr:hypothetical protein [Desulfobacula phenolica]SDU38842.1 hypothetical protein SAMN04487931_107223 [Desulfobacula phenolica]
MEDFINYRILKQPNGLYALYHTERKEFLFTNMETPQAIMDITLKRVKIRLEENIQSYAQKDDHFKRYMEEYKSANGLLCEDEFDPAEEAIAELKEMGVPAENLRKRPRCPFHKLIAQD